MFLEPLLGLLGVGIGADVNYQNNERNIQMQRETNQMNMQIAREANAAQAAESEKAFQRSKATTQVNLMRAAGMSKAGALNALSGGGVYTPAPVNTAQMQSPVSNVDGVVNSLSSLGKGFSNTAQLKQAKEQIKLAKDKQDYDTLKAQGRGTVLGWISDSYLDSLAKGDVPNAATIIRDIREKYKNDPLFKTVDEDVIDRFLNLNYNQFKSKEDYYNASILKSYYDNVINTDTYRDTVARMLDNESARARLDSLTLQYEETLRKMSQSWVGKDWRDMEFMEKVYFLFANANLLLDNGLGDLLSGVMSLGRDVGLFTLLGKNRKPKLQVSDDVRGSVPKFDKYDVDGNVIKWHD